MDTTLADWATPGTVVYELHRSTHDYKTKKVVKTAVESADDIRIVLANGHRYLTNEATVDGATVHYYRDDPDNTRRYFLLVGPDDQRAQEKRDA